MPSWLQLIWRRSPATPPAETSVPKDHLNITSSLRHAPKQWLFSDCDEGIAIRQRIRDPTSGDGYEQRKRRFRESWARCFGPYRNFSVNRRLASTPAENAWKHKFQWGTGNRV